MAVTNVTTDLMPPEEKREADAAATSGRHGPIRFRSRDEFARFFDGLELAPPGIGPVAEWRAENEPQPRPSAAEASVYGSVARKP